MATQTDMVNTLKLSQIAKKFSQHLRKNPATAFILAFEALLLVAAVELIEGNVGGANTIGVYAFVMLVLGVALHAISVIKGSSKANVNN